MALLHHEQPLSVSDKGVLEMAVRELAESSDISHTLGTLTAYVSLLFTVSLYSPGSSQWLSLRLPYYSGRD